MLKPYLLCASLVMCLSCVNSTTDLYRIDLTGDIETSAEGAIHITLHHAWRGRGLTRHPLGPLETWSIPRAEPWARVFEYPVAQGDGLVVYIWQDLDGDGVLCAPGAGPEPSGLVSFEALEHDMHADVALTSMCLGAERLYP